MISKMFRHSRRALASSLQRHGPLSASNLKITRNQNPPKIPSDFHSNEFLAQLPFGTMTTPHILEIDWDADTGYSDPKIVPFDHLKIHPASPCLHYGLQCFEGMKAYYQADTDKIVMFRPDMNARRFSKSSVKIALPGDFDIDELVECIRSLINIDRDWVPKNKNGSLYIRPTHIATNTNLGVSFPNQTKIFVMLSPVGPYFKSGFQPVDLLVDSKYIRAWPGGTGAVKVGGNYGPTIPLQKQAMDESGCSQVLWLYSDGQGSPLITEVGTMNFILIWNRPSDGKLELITPPLDDGSETMDVILPGVTRDSLLKLARTFDELTVTEGPIRWDEFVQAVKDGRVVEAFGAGTACVVCPIGRFFDKTGNKSGEWIDIPSHEQVYREKFYNALTGIQYDGLKPPQENWVVEVK